MERLSFLRTIQANNLQGIKNESSVGVKHLF